MAAVYTQEDHVHPVDTAVKVIQEQKSITFRSAFATRHDSSILPIHFSWQLLVIWLCVGAEAVSLAGGVLVCWWCAGGVVTTRTKVEAVSTEVFTTIDS